MNQWLNRSHPPTLQAAVFLGYLTAVFELLIGGRGIPRVPVVVTILALLGLAVGAFVTANNRRWGYVLLSACAIVISLAFIIDLVDAVLSGTRLDVTLALLNHTVFPTALAAAVVHTQSREYQKIWFE
jgi:hypothetical protein